jgi:ABC-type glycerol-3-phosphate transport system substrate-binding protein
VKTERISKVLFLAWLIVAFILAGCASATATPETADEPAVEEPEPMAEPSDPGKLMFSTWGDPTFFEDGFNRMKSSYPEYADAEWEFLPGGDGTEDLLSKIIVDFAAEAWDTMPDVAEMNTGMIPQLAEAGLLVDLTDLVAPYKDDISPAVLEGITYEGKVWAVPWMPNSGMIWYNVEVFEEAGVDAEGIQTWDDFFKAGEQIRDYEFADGVDRFITSGDMGWGPGMPLQLMLQQECSGFFDPDTGELTIDTDPAFRQAFEFWAGAMNEGILFPVAEWETPWYNGLNEGIIASYPSANWMDQVIQFELENAEGKWRAMKLPAFSPGGSQAAFEGGSANVIVLDKPDADMDLISTYMVNSFFNPDMTGDLLSTHALVPAYIPALSHPYYSGPNEFYGGQEVGRLDKEIQESASCAFPYTENHAEAMDLILVEMQEVWAGNKTSDQAITDAATAIRDVTQ